MDHRSFDSLTRSLASAKTRRGILGSLAAIGAGLAGARAADAQVTQAQCGNKTCANNPGKCSDGCVCCVYSNGNSRCRPPGTCGPGAAVCPPGEEVDPILGCVPIDPCAGLVDGASCGSGLVCSGGQCIGNGVCPTGDDVCEGGGTQCGGQIAICGDKTKCVETPEGGSTCIFYYDTDPEQVCAGGPCAASADCPDGSVCMREGTRPCCGHAFGTCIRVCHSASTP